VLAVLVLNLLHLGLPGPPGTHAGRGCGPGREGHAGLDDHVRRRHAGLVQRLRTL
jgi:hypothetical protein